MRCTENPNQRVQDGLKLDWLCDACERRFSSVETAFATKVFHPWHKGTNCIAYEDWLLKFCVSVSWRVLTFARGQNPDHHYTAEQERLLDHAQHRWHKFLLGQVPHPGEFEQHLLIFDLVEDTTINDLPTNFNRFMTGAVTLDIVGSDRSVMTFAKLGRFMIFGIVQKGPNHWEGTKVHVKHGVLRPGRFVLPAGLLDLFREKAAFVASAMDSISTTQKAKIDQHVLENINEFIGSEQFASIAADARMFGESAVVRKEE